MQSSDFQADPYLSDLFDNPEIAYLIQSPLRPPTLSDPDRETLIKLQKY
jgi:hypothetical protein